MKVAYFGPEGTFTHEAVLAATGGANGLDLVPEATIYDTIMAVHAGEVERALVPIENSVEGAVTATLDTLAIEAQDVSIVGELVRPIVHSLIARRRLELEEIETLVSHPQPLGQCARFIRASLPRVRLIAGASTADAVRVVSERDQPWAALGNTAAADRYGCVVLREGVQDEADNQTRFVWLARTGSAGEASGWSPEREPPPDAPPSWKTAIVFWGAGSEAPGWLVDCLTELSSREVNMTRIESRPRRIGLGQYMFFVDFEGRGSEPRVAEALGGLRGHVEVLRVLGSFPAA
jgi:prephenate dehydratase